MVPTALVRSGALPRRFLSLALVLLQVAVAGELLADPGCAEHRAEHSPEAGAAASPGHHHAAHDHGHAHSSSDREASDAPPPDRHRDHDSCICVGVCHAASPDALGSTGETAGEDTVFRSPAGVGRSTGIIPIAPAFLLPFATAPPVSR